ncbi:MAG: HDOD domain-containing protein [Dehalococcoidia bacterium]|nr:HDOD domain-containing protein [Dehalococcoidia bacterium]
MMLGPAAPDNDRDTLPEGGTGIAALDIPSLPVAQARAFALVATSRPAVDELEALVDTDPALTASVLRAANSARSAPVDRIATARTATIRIGIEETRRIVLGTALRGAFDLAPSGIDLDELWRHLVACAIIADTLAEDSGQHTQAFTAGLLHDLGRLAMAAQDPHHYAEVVEQVRDGEDAVAAERAVFATTHVEWGVVVAGKWELPDELVDAVASHHLPAASGLGGYVWRARQAAHRLGIGDGVSPPPAPSPDGDRARAATLGRQVTNLSAHIAEQRGEPDATVGHGGGTEHLMTQIEWYRGALQRAA